MREEDVPQEKSFYQGHRRACYAVGKDEQYVLAKSAGWEVERVATEQALLELEEQVEDARLKAEAGAVSPLAYHFATRQMTPKMAAQHAGLSTWRVKRHLKPAVFARLSKELKSLYSRVLDVPVEELERVPSTPRHVFLSDEAEANHG